MKNKILSMIISMLIMPISTVAYAQNDVCSQEPIFQSLSQHETPRRLYYGDRALMTAAILQKLTIWVRPDGSRVYAEHCRRRPNCEQEVATLVDYIFDVSIQNDFDPWLLAGVAWHESRFNSFAESGEGAYGLLQILRRSAVSTGLSFIHRRWYRERCRQSVGSCQQPIVERSVVSLKRSMEQCGSVQAGLRMYNSGRCDGPQRYTRAVFNAQRDILSRAQIIAENQFVDPNIPQPGFIFTASDRHICLHNREFVCRSPRFEQYKCSERSLMCRSFGANCNCEIQLN